MRIIPVVLAAAVLSVPVAAQQQTYVGVVTDTMCGRDHKAMNHNGPEDKCVRDCVADGKIYKYALTRKASTCSAIRRRRRSSPGKGSK